MASDSWLSRALSWLAPGSSRALAATMAAETVRAAAEATHEAGHDFAGYPATAGYDPAASAAALGRFTWLAATLPRKAADLARLPWMVQSGARGRKGRPLVGHPLWQILEFPNTRQGGFAFWSQVHRDKFATGSGYARIVRDRRGTWVSLLRLAPQSVRPIGGSNGIPEAYEFSHGGVVERLPATDVIHFASPSWQDDPSALSGEGMIEPMHRDLRTDWELQERMRKAATQGRPSGIVSPPDKDLAGGFGNRDVAGFRDELQQVMRDATGGIAILGRPLAYTALDWSPDELDAIEQRKFIREGILAVSGVPPVRVGLETANYATAAQQAETYWGDELQGDSAGFDDVITLVARREFGPPDLYAYRGFADVPALQASRESAIRRASMHVVNGVGLKEAYEAEGLDDIDLGVTSPAKAPAARVSPASDDEDEGGSRSALPPLRVVEPGASREDWWPSPLPAVVTRDLLGGVERAALARDRARAWRRHVNRLHAPLEAELRKLGAAFLAGQRERVAERAGKLQPREQRRNLVDVLLDILFPRREADLFRDHVREHVGMALQRAYDWGSAEVRAEVEWAPSRRDALVDAQLGQLVTRVDETTRQAVGELVRQAVSEGKSTSDLQRALMADPAFAPTRALAIARTETTHSVSAGNFAAYEDAEETVGAIDLEWMAEVIHARPAHAALDGQVVALGSSFVVPDGSEFAGRTARYPGDFGVAALDINCRCGTRPIPRRDHHRT